MAQNILTTNDLIVDSLQLIGELSPAETPDAYMLSRGIMLINEVIDKFAADGIYIPFLTTINFTMVPGQDVYSFSDIVAGTDVTSDRIVNLSFVNYIVNGVGSTNLSYPVRIINKATYNNIVRQAGLLARPGFCFLNRHQDYYNNLKNTNETDVTIIPSVTLTAPEPFYWPNILSY
jgi:hypothetical protein